MKRGLLIKAGILAALAPALLGAQGFRNNLDDRLLASHNIERAKVGMPMMNWNYDLARSAAEWASYLARTGKFEHAPVDYSQRLQGENIWGGTPGHYRPENMVDYWAAEKRYFKAGVFPNNSTTGKVSDVSHYTQMIWRDTDEVGCAIAMSKQEEILVCRYSSHGNIRGRLPF